MGKAIDMLVQEHRVINAVLDCLERFSERAEREVRFDPVAAQQLLSFFKEFADACHHAKEEDLLFVSAQAKIGHHGSIDLLEEEHREGRLYVGRMQHAIEMRDQSESVPLFCQNARDLIGMLRAHIDREDHAVFPMIESQLSTEEMERVWEQFQVTELRADKRQQRLAALAMDLCRTYSVTFPNGAGEFIGR